MITDGIRSVINPMPIIELKDFCYLRCTYCGKGEKLFTHNGDDCWTVPDSLIRFANEHLNCKPEDKYFKYPEAVLLLTNKKEITS